MTKSVLWYILLDFMKLLNVEYSAYGQIIYIGWGRGVDVKVQTYMGKTFTWGGGLVVLHGQGLYMGTLDVPVHTWERLFYMDKAFTWGPWIYQYIHGKGLYRGGLVVLHGQGQNIVVC